MSILKIENPGPEGASMVFLLLRQSAEVSKNSKSQIRREKVASTKLVIIVKQNK